MIAPRGARAAWVRSYRARAAWLPLAVLCLALQAQPAAAQGRLHMPDTKPMPVPTLPAPASVNPAEGGDVAADDPFEGFNRTMFSFNDAIDRAVLRPVASGYRAAVPEIIRTWVGNFFGNFGDAWAAINLALQGKGVQSYEMTVRVATNSVLGFGGLLDIASEAGLPSRDGDFGQTLGYWGVPAGPYLVLPLFGPSQLRETAALPLDRSWSASRLLSEPRDAWGLWLLGVVDGRARLLSTTDTLESIALDKYSFVRDAYVQRRASLVAREAAEAPAAAASAASAP